MTTTRHRPVAPLTPRLPLLPLLALLPLGGCAETAFSPHFRDNNFDDLEKAVAEARAPRTTAVVNATGKPLVFLVTKAPTRVVAYDLERSAVLWSVPADVTSKITVGRTQIFFRAGERTLEARRLADGQRAWSVPLRGGDRLMGIAADGDQVYYSTENTKRELDGTSAYLFALDGDGGKERWQRASVGKLGAPVAVRGRVIMPFRSQSVAIIDGRTGEEIARVRSKEETISWVRTSRSGIVYGGASGVYRLDQKAISGTKKKSTFLAAALPASVRPVYWWDGYNPALSGYTAYDRNRLLWEIAPQRDAFQSDLVVVHNYRFFFAFDAAGRAGKPNLRWVYTFPRQDVVASSLTGSALVLVSAAGEVVVLDPRVGLPVSQKQLKLPIAGATFDADGYTLPAAAAGKPNRRRALSEVIWDPDRRFGAVKLFCVEQLAALSGGRVAEDLVQIVTKEGIDPAVYKRAGEMIVARHDKTSIPKYLETLQSRYSFVDGTRPRAVDIMARALGDLQAKEAIRPLLLHLADHETPLPAVVEIIRALVAIGDKTVIEPFRDFLLTYRCDPAFAKTPEALTLVAEGLLTMGGESERQLLSFIENDANSLASLRIYLGEALRQAKPGQKAKGKAGAGAGAGAGDAKKSTSGGRRTRPDGK